MTKLCLKCGQNGHTKRDCVNPVTSFGLVVFAVSDGIFCKGRMYIQDKVDCNVHNSQVLSQMQNSAKGEILFLLVQRKDTVGFLSLVSGTYPDKEPQRTTKIIEYVRELSCAERAKLKSLSFEDLYPITRSKIRKYEVNRAQIKFSSLDLRFLDTVQCEYIEADYLMPKGRLRFGETKRQCALREFTEESGYPADSVTILDIPPLYEEFTGTDNKLYRNVFYVARFDLSKTVIVKLGEDELQSREVGNMGWFNLLECTQLIRNYHQRKKDILKSVYDFVIKDANCKVDNVEVHN